MARAEDIVERRGQRQFWIEIGADDLRSVAAGLHDPEVCGGRSTADFVDRQRAATGSVERHVQPGRSDVDGDGSAGRRIGLDQLGDFADRGGAAEIDGARVRAVTDGDAAGGNAFSAVQIGQRRVGRDDRVEVGGALNAGGERAEHRVAVDIGGKQLIAVGVAGEGVLVAVVLHVTVVQRKRRRRHVGTAEQIAAVELLVADVHQLADGLRNLVGSRLLLGGGRGRARGGSATLWMLLIVEKMLDKVESVVARIA